MNLTQGSVLTAPGEPRPSTPASSTLASGSLLPGAAPWPPPRLSRHPTELETRKPEIKIYPSIPSGPAAGLGLVTLGHGHEDEARTAHL